MHPLSVFRLPRQHHHLDGVGRFLGSPEPGNPVLSQLPAVREAKSSGLGRVGATGDPAHVRRKHLTKHQRKRVGVWGAKHIQKPQPTNLLPVRVAESPMAGFERAVCNSALIRCGVATQKKRKTLLRRTPPQSSPFPLLRPPTLRGRDVRKRRKAHRVAVAMGEA